MNEDETTPREVAEEMLRERMDDLLTRTANALKGDPSLIGEHGGMHSWHDLRDEAIALGQEAHGERLRAEDAESRESAWQATAKEERAARVEAEARVARVEALAERWASGHDETSTLSPAFGRMLRDALDGTDQDGATS